MKKKVPEIHETPEALHRLLKAENDPQKRQRLHALLLLKTAQATTRLAVAARLAVHRNTVAAWLNLYEPGGLAALLQIGKPPGKTPTLTAAARQALQQRLADPTGFATYGEIRDYLETEHQVKLSYSTVHGIVRYQLRAQPKRPRPSHPKKA